MARPDSEQTAEQQMDDVLLRFAIYMELARTEQEKDAVEDCIKIVSQRIVDFVKERLKEERNR